MYEVFTCKKYPVVCRLIFFQLETSIRFDDTSSGSAFLSGWWFGTFFPCIGNSNPNWLIFFRGVGQPPTSYCWWSNPTKFPLSTSTASGQLPRTSLRTAAMLRTTPFAVCRAWSNRRSPSFLPATSTEESWGSMEHWWQLTIVRKVELYGIIWNYLKLAKSLSGCWIVAIHPNRWGHWISTTVDGW